MRVFYKLEDRQKLMSEFHDSVFAGHRGIWATFVKLKEKYWWLGIYKDVQLTWKHGTNVKCFQMFAIEMNFIRLHPGVQPQVHVSLSYFRDTVGVSY